MRTVVLVLVLVLVATGDAAAQAIRTHERPRGQSVFLDVLEGEWRDALDDADAAVKARDFSRAAQRIQGLIQYASKEGRDELVETPRGGVHESLPAALRRRLAALPPQGLAAYREHVDALAGAIARDAMAAADIPALEKHARRFLFSTAGVRAATFLGDLHLERGDLVGALSTYRLAAEVPGARDGLALRIANARRLLAAADRAARPEGSVEGLAGVTLSARALFEGRRRDVSLLADEGREMTGGLSTPPIPLPGGAIVVRPGRALLVRRLHDAPGGRVPVEPILRTLPPSAAALAGGTPGPIALGGVASDEVAALAIEHSAFLDPDSGGGRRPGEHVFDLYAFDLARDDRLIFTTSEPGVFGADAPWLGTVEWTAVPVLGPGTVFGGATTRSGEPEVYVGAFDAGGPPRLRWKTFVCARGYVPPEDREDAAPLQPGIARAGATILVDSGVGVLAALDAHRGEILWAVRVLDPERGAEGVDPRYVERRLTFPPIIAGDTAVFSPPAGESLLALDVETGAVRWRPAAEDASRPLGTWRGTLVVVERTSIALLDPRTGKRLSRGLPLPQASDAVIHRAVGVGDLILVARDTGMVITLRVTRAGRGYELQPERYSGVDATPSGDLVDLAVTPAGVLAVYGDTLTLLSPGTPEPPEDISTDDALTVARAYGLDPRLTDLFEDLGVEPPGIVLGTDETEDASAGGTVIERAGDIVRVRRPIPGRGRTWVTLEANRATRSLRVRVDPAREE